MANGNDEVMKFVDKAYLEKQFKSFWQVAVKPNDDLLEDKIATLNGPDTVEGSVAYTVSQRIAEIVAQAPEDFDTLKEISDWISSHSDSAAAMNSSINDNASAIEAANGRITDLETSLNTLNGDVEDDGSIAKMIKDAVDDAIEGLDKYQAETEDIDFSGWGDLGD